MRIPICAAIGIIGTLVFHPLHGFGQGSREEAIDYYKKGRHLYEQGKYKDASEAFDRALETQAQEKRELVKKAQEKAETPNVTQGIPEYVVGEEDALFISVWQNKDLDQEVVVRPDGKVSFPLIGDIQASGLTISGLDGVITKALQEYIKYPDVSIIVRKLGGKKIIMLGEVVGPGVRSVTGRRTILEAIALCGGFTNHAVTSSVVLIRGGFTKPKGMRLNLERAISKADMSQNVVLEPEDIVYVPKKFIANVNYFVTQIIGPIAQGMYTAAKLSTFPQPPAAVPSQ